MPVKLHQDVAGKLAGETYTGPLEAYLLGAGYASTAGDDADKSNMTVAPTVANDATRKENREAPGEKTAVKGTELPAPQQEKTPQDPKIRTRRPGQEDDAATKAQTAELDNSKPQVEPAAPTPAPVQRNRRPGA